VFTVVLLLVFTESFISGSGFANSLPISPQQDNAPFANKNPFGQIQQNSPKPQKSLLDLMQEQKQLQQQQQIFF
jgi:hypothetical protein